MEELDSFKGANGQIALYNDRIVISRNGFGAMISFGKQTDKTIYFKDINCFNFKPVNFFKNGYIQIVLNNQQKKNLTSLEIVDDPNSVTFNSLKKKTLIHIENFYKLATNKLENYQKANPVNITNETLEISKDDIEDNSNNEKLEKIKEQLTLAGLNDTWGTKREIKMLPEIINDDETIKFATSGITMNNSQTVLMVLTDQRIIFVNKNMFIGSETSEIPLQQVNGVSKHKGALLGSIRIMNGVTEVGIKSISNNDVTTMGDRINQQVQIVRNRDNQPIQNQQSISVTDEIRKYKSLLDDGIITHDEFNSKKKELLGL